MFIIILYSVWIYTVSGAPDCVYNCVCNYTQDGMYIPLLLAARMLCMIIPPNIFILYTHKGVIFNQLCTHYSMDSVVAITYPLYRKHSLRAY